MIKQTIKRLSYLMEEGEGERRGEEERERKNKKNKIKKETLTFLKGRKNMYTKSLIHACRKIK